jgi:hypothetical protein
MLPVTIAPLDEPTTSSNCCQIDPTVRAVVIVG